MKKPAHVYLVQVGTDGPVKIGYTRAPPIDRMAELQCGCPWPLRLIGAVMGTKLNEAALHEQFAAFRMGGEWFAPEILADVSQILSPNFVWPTQELSPIDRAIALAGSQCDLSTATGVSQSAISLARRTGRIPHRVHQFIRSQEASVA